MSDTTRLREACEHGFFDAHLISVNGVFVDDDRFRCPGGRERTFETYLAEVQLPGRFAEFIDVLVEVTEDE